MSEEEKAIETLKEVASDDFDTLGDDISPKMAQSILNVINKQQKELNFYKKEELGYIAGYEDGKRHKQTAVMIKKENAQQELFEKEIEKLNFENHMLKKWNEQLAQECISKDKIKELKEKVEKEMISNPYDFSYMINELLEENNEKSNTL